MSVPKNSGLPQRRADVLLDRQRGGGGAPCLIEQPQLRGRNRRDMRSQQVEEREVLGLRAQRRVSTACPCSLATFARTLPCPAGKSDITTARPLNISQNQSLPTAASMLPQYLRLYPNRSMCSSASSRAELLSLVAGSARAMVNPHLDAPVRIAQTAGRTPVASDARVGICRSPADASCLSQSHSACGIGISCKRPDAEPHGAPPLLTHNRNYRPPARPRCAGRHSANVPLETPRLDEVRRPSPVASVSPRQAEPAAAGWRQIAKASSSNATATLVDRLQYSHRRCPGLISLSTSGSRLDGKRLHFATANRTYGPDANTPP